MSTKLPKDSLVLITGANGFIGSHVVDQVLALGYRVRGTVRDVSKNGWLQSMFDSKYGSGRFELVEVPDISADGAFDTAVKGCSAFGHVASDTTISTLNAADSVPPMVEAVKKIVAAAAKEPLMRQFVLTSSSLAATKARPGERFKVDASCWNQVSIDEAWADTYEHEGKRRLAIYGASKVQGEKALWDWVAANKPSFSVNAVLPNANFGAVLDPKHQSGSTAGFVKACYDQATFERISAMFEAQHYVSVVDTARIHAGVLTDAKYDGQRFFAFAAPFNFTKVLGILRTIAPNKKPVDDPEVDFEDLSTVENGPALQVLKDTYGQENWISLESALKDNLNFVDSESINPNFS